MLLVVVYDIVDDSQREKLATLLADYGQRVNYSVFECDITPAALTRFLTALPDFVRQQGDHIRVYRLCGHCKGKTEVFGHTRDPKPVVIITV